MSSYSEGQTHQVMEKLEAEGWTPDEVTKFGQYKNLAGFRGVLNGTHKIVPIENKIKTARQVSKALSDDLFPNEVIELGPDNGTRMLADAKETFEAGVDSDFVNWGLNKRWSPKGKINVTVREIIEDGAFGHIFGSLFGASPDEFQNFSKFVAKHREDLRKLCVGQGQVEEFALKHRDKLRKGGYGNFFLLEKEDAGEFFVAIVRVDSDVRLRVRVYRLEDGNVWRAAYRHRFVIPQVADAM